MIRLQITDGGIIYIRAENIMTVRDLDDGDGLTEVQLTTGLCYKTDTFDAATIARLTDGAEDALRPERGGAS